MNSAVMSKAVQYGLGLALTLLVFCYASWGDFSWLTLTGPITLEPDFNNMDAPGYVASPALQAVIIRLLFLLTCSFFCMIPNLAAGLRRHARRLAGLLAMVYLFFSYLLGNAVFFAGNAPGTSTLRITSLVCAGIFLCVCYDTENKNFNFLGLLSRSGFTGLLFCFFILVFTLSSLIFQGLSWFFNERPLFVLLRAGVFLTALTGALACLSWKQGS